MPNWCANRVIIKGPRPVRDAFVARVKPSDPEDEDVLTFRNIVPLAASEDTYDGHCLHWGTKWDACDVKLEHHDDAHTVYFFQTAWSPPSNKILEAIAKMCPGTSVDLRYAERGLEYYGYWSDGEHKQWKFQNDDVVVVDEDAGEYKLREGLALYSDLYDKSG